MAASAEAVVLTAPTIRRQRWMLVLAHCLVLGHSGTPAFCCPCPGSSNCTLTTPAPCSLSLLQAEYRLCNGSDKECTSPTTRVSKKDTLKVGLAQGEERGDTHTPYVPLLYPARVGELGQSMHFTTHICSGCRHRRRTTGRRRSGPQSSFSVP